MSLRLTVSGRLGFRAESGEEFLPQGPHMQALIATLAFSTKQSATREDLLRLLWDAPPDDQDVRLRLRQLLHRLRAQITRAFPHVPMPIKSDKSAIWLDPSSVTTDLSQIRVLLDDFSEVACEQALQLWQGPVLDADTCVTEGLYQWLEQHNRRLRTQLIGAGKFLLNKYLSEGLVTSAVRVSVELAGLDRADSSLQKSAIHTCMTCGSPEMALELYHAHKNYLQESASENVVPELAAMIAPLLRDTERSFVPQSYMTLRQPDLVESHSGPETVCTLCLGIAPPQSTNDVAQQMAWTLRKERIAQLITTSVLALDGDIETLDDARFIAVFRGPAGTETTALRATYAATRIMREVKTLPAAGPCEPNMAIASETAADGQADHEARQRSIHLFGSAKSGQILLCPATRNMVSGIFDCSEVIRASTRVFYVLGQRFSTPRHFEIRLSKGLTPLVGREAELAYLTEKWHGICLGDQQHGMVSGPLGSGKSRLVFEFECHVAEQAGVILHLDCNYIYRNTAYYPIRVFLFTLMGLERDNTNLQTWVRAVKFFSNRNLRLDDFDAVWDRLLKLETADLLSVGRSSEFGLRFTNQLTRLFLKLLGDGPALIVLEDAEWIDRATEQFFDSIAALQSGQGRLMLYTVGQLENAPELARYSSFSLSLGPLSPAQSIAFLDHLDPEMVLLAQDRADIIRASDCLPMYIEEMVKSRFDPDPDNEPVKSLPGVIARRIGDLSDIPDLLSSPHHCGALIDSPFTAVLIARACRQNLLSVVRHLDDLVTRHILRTDTHADRRTYRFAYPSICQYFCSEINEANQRVMCRRLADAAAGLGVDSGISAATHARLWSRGGDAVRAAEIYLEAAHEANLRSEYAEAEVLLSEALDGLIQEVVPNPNLELRVRVELATTLTRGRGVASDQARVAWTEAYAHSLICDDATLRFRIQWGQWSVAIGSMNLSHAQTLSSRILRDSTRLKTSGCALEAHHCAWTTAHLGGHLERAEYHIQRGLDSYSGHNHFDLSEAYGGHDPGVCACVVGSLVSQLRGEPQIARERCDQAMRLAHRLGHKGSMAHALLGVLNLAVLQDRPLDIQNHVRLLEEFAHSEHYFEFGLIADLFEAWAHARLHPSKDAIYRLREAASLRIQTGKLGLPFHMWLVADTEMAHGNRDQADEMITQALSCANASGEVWWKPQLLLGAADIQDAEDASALRIRALRLANQQGALFLAERANRAVSAD